MSSRPHARVREASCPQRNEVRTQPISFAAPVSPWHGGYCGWLGGLELDTHSRTQACVCLCVCSAGGLSFYLGVPSGTRQACPCPVELALPGSSHCDSKQQLLTPNWFDESSEPAHLAGAKHHVQSQARPLLPLWFFWYSQNSPCLLFPQDLSRRRLHVPFAKGSGQTRGPYPLTLREPEPEKRHGSHFGLGPPHSPKLKVRIPFTSVSVFTTPAMMASRDNSMN